MSGPKIVIQMCIQHRSTSMLNSYAENAFSFAERFHITASKVLLVLSQLIILNKFCEAIDSGKEIRAVFCDISKAFDKVWHKGLLQKLKYVGIHGNLLTWLESYLSDRCQQVSINGHSSRYKAIEAGVPQGSIMGPLLFLIYINDIVNNLTSNARLFADDTSLYVLVNNPNEAAVKLNEDLLKIDSWSSSGL